jgi:hypothetical protein
MMSKAQTLILKGPGAALLGACLLVGLWGPLLSAQEIKVPVDIQFDLLTKILMFDRNLKARAGEDIVVGLAFQSLYRESLIVKDEFLSAAEKARDLRIEGLPVRFMAIELKSGLSLGDLLAANKIDVLYVAPLRAYSIADIAAATRARKIMTMTGVAEYVRESLAVGIDSVGGKPKILVNLNGARAEGCDFSSQLLSLATVIR